MKPSKTSDADHINFILPSPSKFTAPSQGYARTDTAETSRLILEDTGILSSVKCVTQDGGTRALLKMLV